MLKVSLPRSGRGLLAPFAYFLQLLWCQLHRVTSLAQLLQIAVPCSSFKESVA
jgi:hypothetical protein